MWAERVAKKLGWGARRLKASARWRTDDFDPDGCRSSMPLLSFAAYSDGALVILANRPSGSTPSACAMSMNSSTSKRR